MRGGAETQTIDLINSIDNKVVEKHLLVFEERLDQLDKVDRDNIKFHHFLRKKKIDFSLIKKISKLIDDNKFDVIHCTLQISLLYAWGSRKFSAENPRIITAIHTTLNVNHKNELIDKYLYRNLFKSCQKMIFVCETQKQFWIEKYPELKNKSHVVYNGINVEYFSRDIYKAPINEIKKTFNIPSDTRVIVNIAGFREEKGHKYLLEAISKLDESVHLVLAGDGVLRNQIENQISELNLGSRVHMLGNVDDVRPVLYISNLSVLASTSVETFSIAMLESMAMNVPMIATDIGGLKEAILPGKSGDLVQPGSADALSDALKKYIYDDIKLISMGEFSRDRVISLFANKMMAKSTQKLLVDKTDFNKS